MVGTVDWAGYVPFDPGVDRPLHELPRREAIAAFDRLLAAKDDRIAELQALVRANGVELNASDDAIAVLNRWYRDHVSGDPNPEGRLDPIWYAVANDVALFLGEVMIQRCPGLGWRMFEKGRKDAAFQRHVIMGFTRVANPSYNIVIDALVAGYGHRQLHRHPTRDDEFLTWIRTAEQRC